MRGEGLAALCCTYILLAACTLDPQAHPEPVHITPVTSAPPTPLPAGRSRIDVYLVEGDRLARVSRAVPGRTLDAAVDALVAGPTRQEVLDGRRTAVAPQDFVAAESDTSEEVAVVEATEQFTAISGESQLLAVAQLVWTLTEVPGVRLVRVTVDGEQVEVPTDRGLVDHPVGRSAYASVQPRPEA